MFSRFIRYLAGGSREQAWRRFKPVMAKAQKLLEPVIDLNCGLDRLDFSWKMPGKKFPYSCTDEEGMILAETIRINGLEFGFEIATAFGYCAGYIGRALADNGGTLTTMDCYYEESTENFHYEHADINAATQRMKTAVATGESPLGLQIAIKIATELNIQNNVNFKVGLSPDDVAELVDGKSLHFAMIDGGHFGDQPTIDFKSIEPFLDHRCAVFFHDNNENPAVERAVEAACRSLESQAVKLNTRYSLTLVGRDLHGSTVDYLNQLCVRNNPAYMHACRVDRKIKRLLRRSS